MRKPAILFSLLISINLLTALYSCNKGYNDDGCGGSTNYTPTITHLKDISISAYNQQTNSVIQNDGNVKATDIALNISMNVDYVALNESKQNFRNPFVTAAYACTPPVFYQLSDSIVAITITSNNDYDDTHKAGANLYEYFQSPELSEINGTEPSTDAGYMMYLNQAPKENTAHKFTIKIRMVSGAVKEAVTNEFIVLK